MTKAILKLVVNGLLAWLNGYIIYKFALIDIPMAIGVLGGVVMYGLYRLEDKIDDY